MDKFLHLAWFLILTGGFCWSLPISLQEEVERAGEEAKWLEPHRCRFVDSYPPPKGWVFWRPPSQGYHHFFWVKFGLRFLILIFSLLGGRWGRILLWIIFQKDWLTDINWLSREFWPNSSTPTRRDKSPGIAMPFAEICLQHPRLRCWNWWFNETNHLQWYG